MSATATPTPALTRANADLYDAIEYLRVSLDRSKRERSVDQQHRDNIRLAADQSWTLGEPYNDNDRSASKFATKARDDFERLLSDLQTGRFRARRLIMWESSRGSREMRVWLDLIEACAALGVTVYVTSEERSYDPANARDRKALLQDGIDNEYASAETSKRVRRDVRISAEDGRPHGPLPFGYTRTRDPRTGKVIEQIPDPATAPIVGEIFDRVRRGEPLRAIVADLEARGIRPASGKAFTPATLRVILRNRAYIGERTHVAGRGKGGSAAALAPGVKAEHHAAAWAPLVSREVFHAAAAVLDGRRHTHPGRARNLLSLIAVCDVCDAPLQVHGAEGTRQTYRCSGRGCVSVAKAETDAYVESEALLPYLAQPDLAVRLAEREHGQADAELPAVREELADLRASLRDLEAETIAGRISPAMAGRVEAGKRELIAAAEAREKALMTPPVLAGLIETGPGVEERWKGLDMAVRRQVARIVLSADMAGQVRVQRGGGRGVRTPVRDRIKWE